MRLGVIILDTLRYDICDEEMPQLKRYGDHIFENLYSTSRWTPPAHASLFTGYFPSEVGTHAQHRHLSSPEPTLAEQLRDANYETVAISNNINIDRFFNFDRGFERFKRGPGIENRPEENTLNFDWNALERRISDSGIRRPLEAIYHLVTSNTPTVPTLKRGFEIYRKSSEDTRGIEWAEPTFDELVADCPDDLFFFANFMTCHYPYNPPERYSDLEPLGVNPLEMTLRSGEITDDEHNRQWSNYVGAVRYLDDTLLQMIDRIDWDLLVVLGDHGELFDEYGLYGHQYGVYEELTHVPAIAIGNRVPEGTTTGPTSIVDIHRTILEAAGIEVDHSHRGINLFTADSPDDRAVYAESMGCEWYSHDATGIEAKIPAAWAEPHYMLRTRGGMLIHDKDGTRVINPDTGEAIPTKRSELQARVERLQASRSDVSADREYQEIPEKIQNQLEQLGYK